MATQLNRKSMRTNSMTHEALLWAPARFITPDTQTSLVHSTLAQSTEIQTALYEQLAATIKEYIRSGEWPAGHRLPSEHELMQAFSLSRGTVRRALKDLVSQGLLVQERGRGTFVSNPTLTHGPAELTLSVAAALAEKGLSFVTHVLAQQVTPAPAEVAKMLGVAAGSPVLFLRRVRETAGKSRLCQESWLNLDACPNLEATDFTRESAFDAVERCSGHKVANSAMRYSARSAQAPYTTYLSCDSSEPLLMLEQLISLDNCVPIEWSRTWFTHDHAISTWATQRQSRGSLLSEAPHTAEALPFEPVAESLFAQGTGAEAQSSSSEQALAATAATRQELEALTLSLRQRAVQFALDDPAHPYHLGGSLSCAEILAALYGAVMNCGVQGGPAEWERRDRLVFSKGHGALTLYPALQHAGLLSRADLEAGLYGPKAHIFKHPKRDVERGIELSAGSLGMGPGYAAGLALSKLRKQQEGRVICLVGDGECNEGSVWESLQFVGHLALNNFVLIVDANGLQLDGPTKDVLDAGSLAGRLSSCGFDVREVNGHDVVALVEALSVPAGAAPTKPLALIAHTHKGEGLSFARDVAHWHDDFLSSSERSLALAELRMTGEGK